jgi:very-short-patch-repair endonuclease
MRRGGTHSTDEEIACDARRSANLQRNGDIVFRAHNTEITENLDGVLDTSMEVIGRRDG